MAPTFACPAPGCSQTTTLLEVLGGASNSAPEKNEIVFTCKSCGLETAAWVAEGKFRVGEKPGNTEIPGLHVYVDPTYGIDCIYQGRLYHMPKRRDVG